MTLACHRDSFPDPIGFLSSLPKRQRNLILAYVACLQTDELEDFGIFLKLLRPDTSDEHIAGMLGVSRSTLTRWEKYRAAKDRFSEFSRIRRQPSKWRRSNRGDRWPLDHPDGV